MGGLKKKKKERGNKKLNEKGKYKGKKGDIYLKTNVCIKVVKKKKTLL